MALKNYSVVVRDIDGADAVLAALSIVGEKTFSRNEHFLVPNGSHKPSAETPLFAVFEDDMWRLAAAPKSGTMVTTDREFCETFIMAMMVASLI